MLLISVALAGASGCPGRGETPDADCPSCLADAGDADLGVDGDVPDDAGDAGEEADVEGSGEDGGEDGDAGDCGFPWENEEGDPFADEVADFTPAPNATFGADQLPEVVLGPPRGAGTAMGSLDVLSLGCGGSVTLRFEEPIIRDGPGPDFIVFENPFFVGGDTIFAEPAEVSVSSDGREFYTFPCDPATLDGCAGVEPVLSNGENCLDPTEPTQAGGDAFDLHDLGLTEARWVRVTDRSEERPDSARWCGGESAGFDLDAMAVVLH